MIRRFTGRHDGGASVLWALRDVSFSVEQGRTLGIIGHNGAGKSTLLRLICGLGRPTAGKIRCVGHVGSLLELGSGFHREMTGRENLLTGGILSGLMKGQVKARQDEIIAFAELEEFIDQPVRTYSTGMYMRLAFATAIHFDPDFVVVDEVLAVGDSRFQQKCLERLKSFKVSGKSLIIVSHDLEQIRALCDEVLVLEEGRVVMQGDPENALNCYYDLMRQRTEKRAAQLDVVGHPLLPVDQGSRMGTQEATIGRVHLIDGQDRIADSIQSGSSLTIELEYLLQKPLPDMALLLGIDNETNMKCFETHLPSTREAFGRLAESGILRCHLPELPLLPGRYFVNVGLWPTDWSYAYDNHWQMHPLNVWNEKDMPANITGVVLVRPNWSIQNKE
jgi:lipopolysaccharide transport system ATP-binding protein